VHERVPMRGYALTYALSGDYVIRVNDPIHPRRVRPPQHPPHPTVAQLRACGFTPRAIAEGIGASIREVSRWAAGDTRPIPVYERELGRLLASASV
jgi:hypothetical protein